MIQKLGKYTIIEKLGEGSMGAVYKAYHDVLDRYVAVKTMAEDIKWEPELKLRFYREARSAAGLRHPNIVTIHDLGEEGKITYIVMELLEGKDIKAIIKDKEPLSLEQKLSIMTQVAEGLSHAHVHGIIHRDIKPGNIHVNPDGNVKILDFGIARIPSSDLTRSGVRLGTPVYMSPEQIRGGDYDERSDMFSAGIVFYELLTYQHPFRDKNLVKTMDNILFLTNLPFQEQFPDAPPGLFPILSRLLEKEPNRRYSSMAEVGRACRQFKEQLSSATRRMAEELQTCIPRLREMCEQPGAAAGLRDLLRQANALLGTQHSPEYLPLQALMSALSRESISPLTPAAAGQLSAVREPTITGATDQPAEAVRPPIDQNPIPEVAAPGIQEGRPAAGSVRPADRTGYPAEKDQTLGREMFQKGDALLKEDRPEEALDALRQAMGLLGPKTELVQLLSQARYRIEEKKKLRIQECFNAAHESIANERFSEAIEALDDILQMEPDLPEALELRRQAVADLEVQKEIQARREEGDREKTLGFRLLAEKKFRDSIRSLRRATELLGEDDAIRLGIAEAEKEIRLEELRTRVQAELAEAWQAFRADALDKARVRANRALELSPRNPEALDLLNKISQAQEEKRRKERMAELYAKAQKSFSAKILDEAAASVTEALALDPNDARFLSLMRQITEAKEQIRREEEVNLLLSKSREALDTEEFAEAAANAESALTVIPGHPRATQMLREIQSAKEEKRKRTELAEMVSEAQQAYLRGDMSQCEALAKKLLERDPQNRKAKELIQLCEQARERARLEKLAQIVAQGRAALSAGDLQSAERYATEAQNLEAGGSEAKGLRAEIDQARKRALAEKVARIIVKGRAVLEAGDIQEASKIAQEALLLDPQSAEAQMFTADIEQARKKALMEKISGIVQKGRSALQTGDFQGASRLAREAIDLDVQNAEAKKLLQDIDQARQKALMEKIAGFMSQGRSALRVSDFQGAQRYAQQILNLDPQNAEANQLLADTREAEEKARRAEIAALLDQSRLALSQFKFDEASSLAQKVTALDPKSKEAKSLVKDIEKAKKAREKELKKEEKELEKKRKEEAKRETDIDDTAPMRKPLVEMIRSSLALKIGIPVAALFLVAAVATGFLLLRKRPPIEPKTTNIEEQISTAQAHLSQKRYDKAIEIAQQVLAAQPGNAQAQVILSTAQKESRQLQLEALLIEAQNLKAQNQLAESRQVLEKLLTLDSSYEPALKVIAEIDAALSATKSTGEQDVLIAQWLKSAADLMDSGKLAEAKAELDKIKKIRPAHPQLAQLYKQWDIRNSEITRRQKEQSEASQRQGKVAEMSHSCEELLKQGQYEEAQRAIEQLIALAPQNNLALGLRNQVSEALRQIKLYDTALANKSYDEALLAVARLEKANPADPGLAERRKRVEGLKASAKAQFSVYRLAGEAAIVLLDDQRIDSDGEVQNKVIPIGKHTLTVRNSRGLTFRSTIEFTDGQNLQFVYDAEKPDMRAMTPADRQIMEGRKSREQIYTYAVEHNHTFGKCSGELRISGASVEYKAAKGDHSFVVPLRDMKLAPKDDKLEFTDKKGTRWRLTPADAKVAKEILQLWGKLEKAGR